MCSNLKSCFRYLSYLPGSKAIKCQVFNGNTDQPLATVAHRRNHFSYLVILCLPLKKVATR